MEKYITDERTGLKYELVGDYYFIAGEDQPEVEPIGLWGQRQLRYIKQYRKLFYAELLTTGKLHDYLAEIDCEAAQRMEMLVSQMKSMEGVTEQLKAEDPMA